MDCVSSRTYKTLALILIFGTCSHASWTKGKYTLTSTDLKPGQSILILAKLPEKSKDFFQVEFFTNNGEPDHKIAFLIEYRMDGKFALNSKEDGKWMQEIAPKTKPLALGEPIEIEVDIKENRFEVKVNGEKLSDFDFRVPLSSITNVGFDGNIEVKCVRTATRKCTE